MRMMIGEELLREAFVSLEVNDPFTEAGLRMRDGSRLCFYHRVGKRWAKLAGQVLSLISLFRLNGKHLDVRFDDGSRWEAAFKGG